MTKRIGALLIVLILLGSLTMTAYAVHEVPDYDTLGSISISMTYKGKAVPYGSLTLYRVADVDTDNGDYFFTYTEDFADCSIPVTELSSSNLSAKLAEIAKTKKLTGVTQLLNSSGKTTFKNLEIGLYLLVQNKAAPGYTKVSPFLVSVPANDDGHYIYDVDASPKVGAEPSPTETTTTSDKLPQTGQIQWPVPVMAVLGLFLVVVGRFLCASDKKKGYEGDNW